ncbi:MAG: hypothetical protein ACLQDY_02780 [Streptosporangiaceae bacterium]
MPVHEPHQDWHDLRWSAWVPVEDIERVPAKRGIYRLRCQSSKDKLIYVGISDRLSSRLNGLRRALPRARQHMDDQTYVGHSAARCVVQHQDRGESVEVSWAEIAGIDRRELMGLEVDLIAACRAAYGHSPACQFHGE